LGVRLANSLKVLSCSWVQLLTCTYMSSPR
jgi:hypothetical protein